MVHLLQMDPFFSVGVVENGLLLEAVVELHELHDILGCFFEYNQAVDWVCVELKAIVTVESKLCEELEDTMNDVIICMEGIEGTFNDRTEILWIEPIKEKLESATANKTTAYAFQDVH